MPGRMQEVELLEEGADDPDLSPPAPDGADLFRGGVRRALAWARGHLRVVVAGAAVVTVVAAVPFAVGVRAERDRLADLAGHPGILLPLDASLHVAWTSTATFEQSAFYIGQERAWLRDDVLVTWTQSWEDASHALRGIDAGSGSVLWEVDLSTASVAMSYVAYDPTTCLSPHRPHGTGVVVCLVVGDWRTGPEVMVDSDGDGTDDTAAAEPGTLRLVSFSALTGEPLAEREVENDTSIAVVEEDVVLAEAPHDDTRPDDDTTARVTRVDPETGAELWHADIPRAEAVGSGLARVQVTGGEVAVSWMGGTHLLSAADGTPTRDAIASDQVWPVRGRLALSQEGSGTLRLTLIDSDAELDLGDRHPAWTDTDDGSDPGALVLSGEDSLSVSDLDSGEVRWSVDVDAEVGGFGVSQRMVLGGLLVTSSGAEVSAVDLVSGEELWSISPVKWLPSPIVSDARHLFLLESGGDTGRVLAAYALADGARAWEVPVPNELERMAVVSNQLFGIGPEGITAFTTGG